MRLLIILFLLQIIVIVLCKKKSKNKTPSPIVVYNQSMKFSNPNAILDRKKLCKKKSKNKTPSPIVVYNQSMKFSNPNAILDRKKRIIYKPAYPVSWGMDKKQPYSVNWMDYCDPYHCGDYHKPACGLNRRRRKFQWFQSGCHIVLNNACATYRGFLKFDQVDTRYCRAYVMFALRSGCPQSCPKSGSPVCAVNVLTNKAAVFKNICYLYKRNCQGLMQDFVEVTMNVCLNDITLAVEALKEMTEDELKNNELTSDEVALTENGNNPIQEIGDEEQLENKLLKYLA